jgi:hypothetical protein
MDKKAAIQIGNIDKTPLFSTHPKEAQTIYIQRYYVTPAPYGCYDEVWSFWRYASVSHYYNTLSSTSHFQQSHHGPRPQSLSNPEKALSHKTSQ